MALSYDFSVLINRLDKVIHVLFKEDGDKLFPNNPPLVRESTCKLRECLQEMSRRGLRTCFVHYEDGVSATQRKCSIRRKTQSGSLSPSSSTDGAERGISGEELQQPVGDKSLSTAPSLDMNKERDETLESWAHHKYQFLDMRDVLCLLLEQYAEVYGPNGEKSERPARDFLDELLSVEVGDVANMSTRNGFTTIYDSCTFGQLLKKFEDSPRIPVFQYEETASDKKFNPTLVGIFSVIDLLNLLSPSTAVTFTPGVDPLTTFAKKPEVTSLDTWTAGNIKVAIQPSRAKRHSELLICFEDECLFDVMRVLHVTGFSAIPIVARADPRRCIGIFSVRDLQPILLKHTDLQISGALLNIPILDYVCNIRRMQSLKAKYPVTHVRRNATIDAVIGKILATNVRRILLTDDEGLLTDVLSVTDLGRFVAKELVAKP